MRYYLSHMSSALIGEVAISILRLDFALKRKCLTESFLRFQVFNAQDTVASLISSLAGRIVHDVDLKWDTKREFSFAQFDSVQYRPDLTSNCQF